MSRRFILPAGALLALAVLLVGSCYPFLGTLPAGAADPPTVMHVPFTGSFTYSLDAGSTAHDVYFVFTNPDTVADVASGPSVASGSISVDGKGLPAPVAQPLASRNSAPTTVMDRIAEFNRNPSAYLFGPGPGGPQKSLVSGLPANSDVAGTTNGQFWYSLDGATMSQVTATCRLVVGPVTFADGRTRTLSIWVENAQWGTPIDATMVQDMANKFLMSPEGADIYHWDTAVVGGPWGAHTSPAYIDWDAKNTITILLADLNQTYSGPVTVGYFWSKDNYTTTVEQSSNQRIMFYMDATLYASLSSGESSWAPTNYWPKIIYSTLAHEFQHMIQFYQKQVVYNIAMGTDTWINEMCSMIMEDLVADKQSVEGPRGVPLTVTDGSAGLTGITDGRIPDFNATSYSALANTGQSLSLTDYSVAYTFGAWLARNYGGAALLRRIVQCPQTDPTAIVNAVEAATGSTTETFADLLGKWSAAVLLSSSTSAPAEYQYNIGTWFTSTLDNQSYNLGSIDVFNYSPTLKVFGPGATAPSTTNHSSNTFYQAAASLSGARSWKVSVPDGVVMNVILR